MRTSLKPLLNPRMFSGAMRGKHDKISEQLPYDPGKQYDVYYNGEQSIYDDLYKGNIPPADIKVVSDTAVRISDAMPQEHKTFHMLDYGAGDGRYLKAFLPVAAHLQTKGIHAVLTAYDPSKVGLQQFERKLKHVNFKPVEYHGYRDIVPSGGEEQTYLAGTYSSKEHNLTVRFVHGNIYDDPQHISQVIGDSDLTTLFFGVQSHIPGRENRVNTFAMLANITSHGAIIATFPGRHILSKEQKTFDFLRQKSYTPYRLGEAREPGDVYYTRKDGERFVENFYHVYTGGAKEVETELAQAGLVARGGIGIQKILHETTLARHPWLAEADGWLSSTISKAPPVTGYELTDAVAGYYLAIAERPRVQRDYPRPVSRMESYSDKIERERKTVGKGEGRAI